MAGLCGAVAALCVLPGLDRRPLLDAEARYALVGLEMLRSGDWTQPRLNTFPYYEKPPLLYWSLAASYRALGADERASRLPSAAAHVGTTLVVFALAAVLSGGAAAAFAGLVYATAAGPATYARFCFPDGLLVFSLTVSLLGMALAVRGRAGWPLVWIGAAGAVLSKGLVGVAFPLAAAAAYLLLTRDRALVARLHPGGGALVLLGLVLPWHVALAVRDPAFVPFYVLNEHVYRFLNTREPIDYVPLSVAGFWLATACWLMPWTMFLPAAAASLRRHAAPLALPLIWSAVVVGFFTLAQSRLERYGIPALPALAVVLGAYWQRLDEEGGRHRALTIAASVVVLGGLTLVVLVFVAGGPGGALSWLVAALDGHYREHPQEARLFLAEALRLARPFSVLLLAFGLAALVTARLGRVRTAFAVWVACVVVALLFADRATQALAVNRSQREAAEIINRHWEPGARVAVAGLYDDAMSVTFYTRRPTYLVDGQSTDLAFGIRQAGGTPLVLTGADLQTLWRSSDRLFLLTDQRPLPPDASVLLDRPTYALITNRPLTGTPRGPATARAAAIAR